jgi:hypothetical protein
MENDDARMARDQLFRWFTETQAGARRKEDLALLRDYYTALRPAERTTLRGWLEGVAAAVGQVPRGCKVEAEVQGVVCPGRGGGDPVYMVVRLDPRDLVDAVRAWDAGGKELPDPSTGAADGFRRDGAV